MTPVVVLLLELCHQLAQLKGQKPKPVIKPSALEGERSGKDKKGQAEVRGKRDKTAKLEIHEAAAGGGCSRIVASKARGLSAGALGHPRRRALDRAVACRDRGDALRPAASELSALITDGHTTSIAIRGRAIAPAAKAGSISWNC
jgi:hypothetical protein